MPADTKIEVSKGSSAVEGETKIDGSTVTFDTTANLTAGTYTLTATLGETKVSADVDVKDSHVAEIKITSKEALTKDVETTTGAAMKEAFIYYDVFNQYGESIKNSTTIDWTTSVGNGDKKVDKSLGKITVKAEQSALNYGSQIYVTGVHSTSGTVINTSIPVGMAQAVDSIEFAGFLNKNDKTKLLENLPADFQKDTYYLLYKAFDQNGSPYEISDIESDSLTFIADQPLLLSLEDTKDSDGKVQIPTFTVKGEEYAAIRVQPGQYVDKGGEVNITVIANKTGTKKTQNFVIGSSGILQSFTLSAPASTVADGDRDVKIPYVAKDVSGNTITNYETIVRSTNSLQLTATDGKLKVKEENDGTAGVYWSDSKYDPEKEEAYSSTAVCDGVVRNISLNTVVMSGESSNLMLEVSDIRRPDAIKSLKLNDDNNDTIVSGNKAKMSVKKGDIIFLDQYGAELDSKKAKAFFEYAGKNSFGKGNEAGYYGIRVVNTSTGSKDKLGIGTNGSKVYKYSGADLAIDIAATTSEKDDNTVKYSIARTTKSDASVSSMSAWDDASKVKSVTYTIVPVKNLKNFTVSGLNNRIQITTDLSEEINGEAATGSSFSAKTPVLVNGVKDNDNAKFKVQGTCDGKTVTLPNTAYQAKDSTGSKVDSNFEGSAFDVEAISYNIEESRLTNVTGGALLWSDIYDFNAYGKPRKDAKINLEITITGGGNASKSVTISDALESPVSVVFSRDYKSDIKEYTLNPVYGEINGSDLDSAGKIVDAAREIAYNGQYHVNGEDDASGKHTGTKLVPVCDLEYAHPGELVVYYVDQYGVKHADPDKIEFTVSDIVENTDTALAHVPDSFIVNSNGTTETTISGAEIGDTFKLTAKVKGTDITASIKVVVGADKGAYIDEDGGSASKTGKQTLGKIDPTNAGAKDKYLRELLGYSR